MGVRLVAPWQWESYQQVQPRAWVPGGRSAREQRVCRAHAASVMAQHEMSKSVKTYRGYAASDTPLASGPGLITVMHAFLYSTPLPPARVPSQSHTHPYTAPACGRAGPHPGQASLAILKREQTPRQSAVSTTRCASLEKHYSSAGHAAARVPPQAALTTSQGHGGRTHQHHGNSQWPRHRAAPRPGRQTFTICKHTCRARRPTIPRPSHD